ncbi:MAG: hypothetical protein AAF362_10215 [Pseudomonadota bacterium]
MNDIKNPGSDISGVPVLGSFADWPNLAPEICLLAAIHKPKTAIERFSYIRSLDVPDERWISVRHPFASIAAGAKIGAGSYVGPSVNVMPDAVVERHCSLRGGCYVSHDVRLGEFSFVGPNAVLSGRTVVETGAHIGPGAQVREEILIGEYSLVTMGAVVTKDVAPFTIVGGNPARAIGEIKPPNSAD